jgi:aerobic carbon-monoxide dehydrogenase small subunit
MSEQGMNNFKKKPVTRREFLRDAGLVAGGIGTAATGMVTTTSAGQTTTGVHTVTGNEAVVPSGTPGTPTKPATITLTVNGQPIELSYGKDITPGSAGAYDVYPWHTLAWTLREALHLTGTKIGCDRGECGACTVLLNGTPVLSCMILTYECDGKNIETVESLADSTTGALHPIQQAFVENHGFQCGFCAPAAMMVTKALLTENPNPTNEEITNAFSGVLCRCTGYLPIFQSASSAAAKSRGAYEKL